MQATGIKQQQQEQQDGTMVDSSMRSAQLDWCAGVWLCWVMAVEIP
jgi:hypothetical protein